MVLIISFELSVASVTEFFCNDIRLMTALMLETLFIVSPITSQPCDTVGDKRIVVIPTIRLLALLLFKNVIIYLT